PEAGHERDQGTLPSGTRCDGEGALGDARVRGPGAGCADRRATRWHAGMGRLDAGLDGAASSDDEAKPAALMVSRAAVALAVMLSVRLAWLHHLTMLLRPGLHR